MNRPKIESLLAKSCANQLKPHGGETLQGHTACVLAAAEALLEARGQASLAAAGLTDVGVERLGAVVRTAAFAHDLGKCSDHFQLMVRKARREPQLVRHEALSLWLCWPGQPLAAWLRPAVASDLDYRLAIMAAAGHHRKFWASAFAKEGSGAGSSIKLLLGHPGFAKVLAFGKKMLGLGEPPALEDLTVTTTVQRHPQDDFERWQGQAEELLRAYPEGAKLLAVAKALLLGADVAGSALWKAHEKPAWIGQELGRRPTPEALQRVVAERLKGQTLRPFQRAVAASQAPLTLVRAGCGTGKTVAAYQWASEQWPGRQVWVTYPTTGTTTEGFRDYINGLDSLHGLLEHGRAKVDYKILGLKDGDGTGSRRDFDRLEAMRAWGAEVVTCTVDTVLGLTQNHRKGLYAWPGLSHAAVIFDEIHAYDDLLFGSLLRFLEALPGVPCLLMTASLPAHRQQTLERLSQQVHGRALAVIDGPRELEALPRYRLLDADDPMPLVEKHLSTGGKVLWVSNTVARCMKVAEGRPEVLLYHSRFRYVDRVQRHKAVIEAFAQDRPAWVSTTQVAEMSLDLSATLLVTDRAPVPAMIQRLGRLNRRSTPERPAPLGELVVLPFEAQEPYPDKATMSAARAWVESLRGRPLCQRDLVDAWAQNDGSEAPRAVASAWLDGGFKTEPRELRESSPGLTVLLEDDAKRVKRGEVDVAEVALPMSPPRGFEWPKWEQVNYHPVAPADCITYDEMRGGAWRK